MVLAVRWLLTLGQFPTRATRAVSSTDSITVEEGEEKELLKDFKPDTLGEEYGLCPEFVEALKKPDSLAEVLKKRYEDFWSQHGRCGRESEMNYRSNRRFNIRTNHVSFA